MKGKLAIAVLSWLRKRENRDKVKHAAGTFKSRIEKDEGLDEAPADATEPKRGTGNDHRRAQQSHTADREHQNPAGSVRPQSESEDGAPRPTDQKSRNDDVERGR